MRKHTKRKHWGLVDVISHAISGAAVTSDDLLNKLKIKELSSLDALSKGRGGLTEWSDMANVLNIAETMGMNGVGPEVLEVCKTAQNALYDAAKRYEQTNRMGLSGQGIQALRDLLEYHDLQRKSVCRAEYYRHIEKTQNRLRSKAAGVVEI